jgi:hypothetical protein
LIKSETERAKNKGRKAQGANRYLTLFYFLFFLFFLFCISVGSGFFWVGLGFCWGCFCFLGLFFGCCWLEFGCLFWVLERVCLGLLGLFLFIWVVCFFGAFYCIWALGFLRALLLFECFFGGFYCFGFLEFMRVLGVVGCLVFSRAYWVLFCRLTKLFIYILSVYLETLRFFNEIFITY